MLPFVDISENNGNYNMAANTDQLIAIRVSTGADGLRADTMADINYKNAYDAYKRIIQFHYCGTNDPTTEANLFLAVCRPFNQYDMFCIDAELGQSKAWKQTFADVVLATTGCHVFDYMDISKANALGALPDCALWLAAPSWPFNQPVTEFTNGEYLLQQGPAVNGVDTDMAYCTLDVIDKYGYQPLAVTTPPAPPPVVTPPSAPVVIPVQTPVVVNDPLPATPVTTPSVLQPPSSTPSLPISKPPTTKPTVVATPPETFLEELAHYQKGVVAFLTVALSWLATNSYLVPQNYQHWYQLAIGILGAIGVVTVANKPRS